MTRARLPSWILPPDWPTVHGVPGLADIEWSAGAVTSIGPNHSVSPGKVDLGGAPVLPGLVDAHTHLDKTFTVARLGPIEPGLLPAIEAMHADSRRWTAEDLRKRATQALGWARAAGVVRLRTHVDWWRPGQAPLAWAVLAELATEWADRIELDRVSLIPLDLFADPAQARRLARTVAAGGPGAVLGGFVHSHNWNARALRQLFEEAQACGLDVDLHCDEELDPAAAGLAETARLLHEMDFGGRVVCGHVCALAAQADALARSTLDAVARAPISLIALPITNLLLQDAQPGRTPRQRGLTLLKEARARGIPVLIASDNVQDAFCPLGSYDPVEALMAGVLAGQLPAAFDTWSESLCRADWLDRAAPGAAPSLVGAPADFVAFTQATVPGWPSRAQSRLVWHRGRLLVSCSASSCQ